MDPLLEAFFTQTNPRPPPRVAGTVTDMDIKWDQLRQSAGAVPASLLDALLEIVVTNKSLKDKIQQLEDSSGDVDTLRHRLNTSPFVLLLIDGDATQFSDAFVGNGVKGGHKAAHHLQQSLEDFMERKLGLPPVTKVVTRVYMNAVGLKTAYVASEVLTKPSAMWEFVQGFNRELPLAEFVDAGADKEAADNKIKANIDLFWRNENCKHILLAGSADRGYVNYLRQFSFRKEDRARLTLIETKPYPQDFRELASSFGNAEGFFVDLFRPTHLVVNGKSAGGSKAHQVATTYATVSTQQAPAMPTRARSSSGSQSSASASSDWTAVQRANAKPTILLNKKNQRIHKPLEPYDGTRANEIKQRNLCPYKILTHCAKPDCDFNHDDVNLTKDERRVLIYVHRIVPCPAGFSCRDRNCVSGHHCLFDETCYFQPCRYTKIQHNVDKNVAKEI